MSSILAILLIQLLASPFPPAIKPIAEAERSIIKVDLITGEDQHPLCTGFVVSATRGEAITAAHCLPEDGQEMYVDGAPSKVIRSDANFALVSVEKMKKPPLSIRKGEAVIGEEIHTYGFAWGEFNVFRRMVSAWKDGAIVFDGPLAPGMSGGPVIDANGEVVGVNEMANSVIGIAAGSKALREFLKLK